MTQTRYKLTTQARSAYRGFKWTPGEWVETSGDGELCDAGWTHWYTDPLLAVIFNPIHASIYDPLLWRGEVDGTCCEDHGLKEGWTRGRIVEQIALPTVTTVQKIAFAILTALEVYDEQKYVHWAHRWLSGEDRSRATAQAARVVVACATEARAMVVRLGAEAAAVAAAPANAADVDTEVAASVDWTTTGAGKPIDLIALARKAMEVKP
jgi:hypothetical protein